MAVVESRQSLNGGLKIDISKYIYRAGQEESDSESSMSFSSDDENYQKNDQNNAQSIESKEDLCDLPPIELLQIDVKEEELEPIGQITGVVQLLVIVYANKGCPHLNEDSILFLHNLKPLGKVFEVLGPVVRPLYAVRFDSIDEIKERNLTIGMPVFYAPGRGDISIALSVDALKQQKGSDASWAGNAEPPDNCIDYSDDEEERVAKRKIKEKVCGTTGATSEANDKITLYPCRIRESGHHSIPDRRFANFFGLPPPFQYGKQQPQQYGNDNQSPMTTAGYPSQQQMRSSLRPQALPYCDQPGQYYHQTRLGGTPQPTQYDQHYANQYTPPNIQYGKQQPQQYGNQSPMTTAGYPSSLRPQAPPYSHQTRLGGTPQPTQYDQHYANQYTPPNIQLW